MFHVLLNRTLFVVALLLVPATHVCGQKTAEYKVYDVVIRHMFHNGITRFDMNATIDQIVIRDRTFSDYARGPDKEDWNHAKMQLRSLTSETITAYETARREEMELKAEFDIPFKYVLIADKQLVSIFGNTKNVTNSQEPWEKFYESYPRSAGYNSFSRVGFDKGKRQALVYFVNWCGQVCGTGTYVLLEAREDRWTVKETAMMWIS